jgi:hypothetical protein
LFPICKEKAVRWSQNKLDLNELRNYTPLDIDNFGSFFMSGTQTPAGIPAVAAAVGYNTETFGPAVTLGSNWTPFSYFGNDPSSIQATQNADGSVTIQDSGNNYGAQLESTEAFGGGGYFQATMAFPSGSAGGGTFWANDIQNMVDGNNGGNWVETDIAEFDDDAADQASDSYQIQYHNWYGGAGSTAQVYGETGVANVPAGTNFAQPNTYGMLWVPATATSQGYIKFYFNGVQVGNTITWNQYVAGQSATQNPFAVIDSRQLDLLLGTGGSPTTVYNVQVWQSSAADDVSLGSTPTPTPTPAPTPTPTPAPTPTPTPTAPPSANDTVVYAGSSDAITDGSGNAWTITSGGQVAVNGTTDTTTGNVTELAYVNGEVWQENSGGYWWGKTSPTAAWSPSAGTTTSPLPSAPTPTPTPTPAPTPTATPSANDTVVYAGSSDAITDGSGNAWTITSGGQVAVNGTTDTTTGNVTELAYVNGEVWQENSGGYWWGKTSPTAAWSPSAGTTTSPLPSASTPTPTPTPAPTPTPTATPNEITPTSGGTLTDSAGNQWTLTSAGVVQENGVAVPGGSGTAAFAIVNNVLYGQDATSKAWFTYSTANQYWSSSAAPTATLTPPSVSTPTPTSTSAPTLTPVPVLDELTPASGGTLYDNSGNTWTLTSTGIVQENGAAVPDGSDTAALAVAGNVVYGQDAVSKDWFTFSLTNQYWSSSAAPPTTPTVTFSATQASGTINQNTVSIVATSGNHMVFISGSGDTVNLSGGTNTITDTGSGNTYVIPAAGKGSDVFTNDVLKDGDTLDLRSALAATTWNGSATTLANYLTVTNPSQGTVLSIASTSGGTGVAIATINGATGTTLSSLLAHALT